MTKQLQSELGSGALRELLKQLEDWRLVDGSADADQWRKKWLPEIRRVLALSLSSPIEPRERLPDFRKMAKDFLHSEGGDEVDTLAAAFAMIDGNAAQRAQASSEIRAKMMASFDKVIPSFEMRVQIVNCILRALALSRQGAAKRVEG